MHGFSIGKLAKAAKVSIYTIRFYEKCGLLPQPSRRASGFRVYSNVDIVQLQFVRQARALGFSIEEITELLALEDDGNGTIVDRVIERKLAIVDRKIAQLEQWRQALYDAARNPDGHLSREHFLLHFSAASFTGQGSNQAQSDMASPSKVSHDKV